MHTVLRGLYYLGGRVLLLAPKASLFEGGGFAKQRRREFSSSNPGRRSYWLDPRANQSPTGALVTVLCTAALFDSRTGQIKNALARMRKGVFMTRTGIEPMLQP